MTIRLDTTACSVVICCSDCPSWRAVEIDKPAAWAAGARHEAQVHRDHVQARDAARRSLERSNTGSRT